MAYFVRDFRVAVNAGRGRLECPLPRVRSLVSAVVLLVVLALVPWVSGSSQLARPLDNSPHTRQSCANADAEKKTQPATVLAVADASGRATIDVPTSTQIGGCAFGHGALAVLTNATATKAHGCFQRCETPPWNVLAAKGQATRLVPVNANDKQAARAHALFTTFALRRLEPAAGPAEGGTQLTARIHFDALAADFPAASPVLLGKTAKCTCHFGNVNENGASVLASHVAATATASSRLTTFSRACTRATRAQT